MTAGRGIIHSEMPQQDPGPMRGFQLRINLPAREKMCPAAYEDIGAECIPTVSADGATIKLIAGSIERGGKTFSGSVSGVTTEPIFFNVTLAAGATFSETLPVAHSAYLYVFEGELSIAASDGSRVSLPKPHGGVLGEGDALVVMAGKAGARFLLLAAAPLGKPIVQYGPFVMNTCEEIDQAIRDYQHGRLVVAG